jgi:hypothetical protein
MRVPECQVEIRFRLKRGRVRGSSLCGLPGLHWFQDTTGSCRAVDFAFLIVCFPTTTKVCSPSAFLFGPFVSEKSLNLVDTFDQGDYAELRTLEMFGSFEPKTSPLRCLICNLGEGLRHAMSKSELSIAAGGLNYLGWQFGRSLRSSARQGFRDPVNGIP